MGESVSAAPGGEVDGGQGSGQDRSKALLSLWGAMQQASGSVEAVARNASLERCEDVPTVVSLV